MLLEPLTFDELKLLDNAKKFVADHIFLIDKPIKIVKLPDDYPHFASMSNNTGFYLIGVRTNIGHEDFDTNFCHELYHAYQLSKEFPVVIGFHPDTSKFCENLRSTILDLSANDALKSYGLTYNSVIKTRYIQVKHLCATSFKEIATQYAKDLLTIDLILDLNDFTDIQCKKILQKLKVVLPDVYDKYITYHKVIFEQYDYHTKEGCLNIFAYVFEDIGLWNVCSIQYQGKEIRTIHRFKRLIQPTS